MGSGIQPVSLFVESNLGFLTRILILHSSGLSVSLVNPGVTSRVRTFNEIISKQIKIHNNTFLHKLELTFITNRCIALSPQILR